MPIMCLGDLSDFFRLTMLEATYLPSLFARARMSTAGYLEMLARLAYHGGPKS
jgi:hypothetical protein